MPVQNRVRSFRNYRESMVASHRLALDSALANLYAGTAEGLLYHFSLTDSNQPPAPVSYRPSEKGLADCDGLDC